MENEMMDNVLATVAAEELTTKVDMPSENNGWKNVAIVGGIMTLGALAWEFGVKPIGCGVVKTIRKVKNKRKEKPAVQASDSETDIDDPEELFPIE